MTEMKPGKEIDWRFKELEAGSVGTSNGFWYDIAYGGYIKPEDILSSPAQIRKVTDAVQLLMDLEMALEEGGLLGEF